MPPDRRRPIPHPTSPPPTYAPYGAGSDTHDPLATDTFYARRPLAAIKHVLRLASLTSAFNVGILFDWLVQGEDDEGRRDVFGIAE